MIEELKKFWSKYFPYKLHPDDENYLGNLRNKYCLDISIENLRKPRKRPKKRPQKGSGCESKAKKSRRSGASSNRSKLKNVSNRNRKGLFA